MTIYQMQKNLNLINHHLSGVVFRGHEQPEERNLLEMPNFPNSTFTQKPKCNFSHANKGKHLYSTISISLHAGRVIMIMEPCRER